MLASRGTSRGTMKSSSRPSSTQSSSNKLRLVDMDRRVHVRLPPPNDFDGVYSEMEERSLEEIQAENQAVQDAKARAANDTRAAQQAISDALRAQDEADEVMKEAKKVEGFTWPGQPRVRIDSPH